MGILHEQRAPRAAVRPCRAEGKPPADRAAVQAVQAAARAHRRADPALGRDRRHPALPASRRPRHGDPGRPERPGDGGHAPAGRPGRRDGRDPDRDRRARRVADASLEPRRSGGHARPAHIGLPPPAAAVTGLLHPHAHGRGAEPHRQRHRRDRERRDVDRDVRALERHDRDRDDHRDGAPRLAPRSLRARPAAAVRLADQARRRAAQEGDGRAPGVAGGRLVDRPGVALGLRDPPGEDDGPRRRPRRALPDGVAPARGPRGTEPHDRSLDDGRDPDDVRRDAGARLPVRRLDDLARHGSDHDRHARRVHHAADAPLLPDRQPPRRPARGAELAGALRSDLRVPRPAGGHRRGDEDDRARAGRRRLPRRLVRLRGGRCREGRFPCRGEAHSGRSRT